MGRGPFEFRRRGRVLGVVIAPALLHDAPAGRAPMPLQRGGRRRYARRRRSPEAHGGVRAAHHRSRGGDDNPRRADDFEGAAIFKLGYGSTRMPRPLSRTLRILPGLSVTSMRHSPGRLLGSRRSGPEPQGVIAFGAGQRACMQMMNQESSPGARSRLRRPIPGWQSCLLSGLRYGLGGQPTFRVAPDSNGRDGSRQFTLASPQARCALICP